jgi:hypothetical protein
MKKEVYTYPKSSFLSTEKDMSIIVNMIMKNDRLKKMLHYTSRDCLSKPNLNQDESLALFGKNIKIVPKLYVDGSVLNYIIVSFDNFTQNGTNPEFRDNIVEFDIICHFDQWHMKDFELRPYKIAAELDSMFNNKHLTGIGELQFLGANQMILTDEYAGLCVMYQAIHGEEDKKKMPNPMDEEAFIANFDAMFNDK